MGFKLLIFAFSLHLTNGAVQVPKLKLNDGNEMPVIALGTWLGWDDANSSTYEVEQAVRWALDAGYSHFDTAWIYQVEDQIGRAIKGVPREDVFITTKLWNSFHARNAVVPALRQSLRRLQLDYVDLYLIHWPMAIYDNSTYDTIDYLETWQGMMEAKELGLTRSIGLSNFNQKMIDRIMDNGLEKPAALQVEVNLNFQQPELLDYCKGQDIAVMAYRPFTPLFDYEDPDSPPPRADDPTLIAIAENHNKTVPQIALRYLVDLGVVPLPKSVRKSRIQENIDIFDFQLSEDERNVLKSIDKGYRSHPQYKWMDHPYYPFEKDNH